MNVFNSVGPPYPLVLHPQIQPTPDQKYVGEKSYMILLTWNHPKKKVDTCTVFLFLLPKQYCVASSDIVLEITSNLGINLSIQEDVHILHANTMPFYVRPEHPWILESSGVPEPPPWLLRNNCIGVLYL